MQVARSEHPAVVLDDQIVVVGGLIEQRLGAVAVTASVEAFDGASWRSLPDLLEPRHHAAAAVVDGRLYVAGGFDESGFTPVATVWELVGDRWESRTDLPGPVGAGAAAVVDGRLYLVGGTPESALYRYDPSEDAWERLTSPSEQREHLAAVALGGELWAIGGRWQGNAVSSTEIFDPSSETWRPGPSMNEARSGFGAVTVGDLVVVAGGEVFEPLEALSTVERLENGMWVSGKRLPYGLHGNPLVEIEGTLYVPGGSEQPGGVENRGVLLILDD